MKRILAAVLTAVMAVSLMGCAGAGTGKSHKSTGSGTIPWLNAATAANIENLKKNDGKMLEITSCNDAEEIHTSYVTYDGGVYVSGTGAHGEVSISDEDYMFIYNFCVDAYENDSFADYSEDNFDGTTYMFVFYDTDGAAHELYTGYIDDNEALQEINSRIGYYCID